MKLVKESLARILIPAGAILCFFPFISSGMGLVFGVALVLFFGNPYAARTKTMTSTLLNLSIIGLGAGMDLRVVGRVGAQGIGYTIIGISLTLLIGTLLGKVFKIEKNISLLVTVGTAICGGSAIAAVGSTIRAKSQEMSISLGIVFLLNALALLIFPPIGHALELSQRSFGLWSALAIHDTSSVVGATSMYGLEALQIGTTVKLARALWIIPLTFAVGYFYRIDESQPEAKPKRPWFILGFLAAAALVTWIPSLAPFGHHVETVAKRLLVVTLFLIGTNISRENLRQVGFRPLCQGVILWLVVSSCTLGAILLQWII